MRVADEPITPTEWPDVERRSPDSDDSGRRRRSTDVDLPLSVREVERALQQHNIEAVEWRARHDQRLEGVEDAADANRQLLDGLLETIGSFKTSLENIEKLCTQTVSQTAAPTRWERLLTLLVTLVVASLPVLAAYLAFKGQIAQLTQGPTTP